MGASLMSNEVPCTLYDPKVSTRMATQGPIAQILPEGGPHQQCLNKTVMAITALDQL